MYQSDQQLNKHYAEWFMKIGQFPLADHHILGSQSKEPSRNKKLFYTVLHRKAQLVPAGDLAYNVLCGLHHAAFDDGRYHMLTHPRRPTSIVGHIRNRIYR